MNYVENAIKIIKLHKKHGVWMFNDEHLKLTDEAFVLGSTEVLDYLINNKKGLKNKKSPSIIFGEMLPEYDAEAILVQDLNPSAWYKYINNEGEEMKFWLCPVMTHFFGPEAPERFYVKIIE